MTKITFSELAKSLPLCETFTTYDTMAPGMSYGKSIPEFIPPDVAVEEGDWQQSQVIIIAAPGAVGKSTMAAALSGDRNALIWDLAKAPELAYGSLDAAIGRTVEFESQSIYRDCIRNGSQFMIIDALDEGRIKVNENSFNQLLDNICFFAKNAQQACFVLFGRTQIAESVWLTLTDLKINTSILAIEPFNKEQAYAYIDKRGFISNTNPLYKCRDLIFKQLATPFETRPEFDATHIFLHYPPVLDVIDVLLRNESNPMNLLNFLQNRSAEMPVKLLREVIDRVLLREKDKTIDGFLTRLSESDQTDLGPNKDNLYDQDEQGKRIIASVLNKNMDFKPDALPNKLEQTYNETIGVAMTEHPFLRGPNQFANPVFQSYLYARALRGDFGVELSDHVADELFATSKLPTIMLADFYLGIDNQSAGTPQCVRAEHIGLLYESLLSSELSRRRIRMTIDGYEPGMSSTASTNEADCEIELITLDVEGDAEIDVQSVKFAVVTPPDSTISFRRYIRDVQITLPCAVEFGIGIEEFRIGPSVHILANKLRVGADVLVVEEVPPKLNEYVDTGVTLEANAIEMPDSIRAPIVHASDFSVSWPGDDAYLWRQHRQDPGAPDIDDEIVRRAFLRFRRIATAFRSRGKGALARTKDKIEHPRIMQGPLEKLLLEQLKSDEVLFLGDGGTRYFWNPENADVLLGVSWMDLRNGRCPEKLRQYLSEFTMQNPGL